MIEQKIVFAVCPKCGGKFHIMVEDFAARPDANCHCPFCQEEFPPRNHLETSSRL